MMSVMMLCCMEFSQFQGSVFRFRGIRRNSANLANRASPGAEKAIRLAFSKADLVSHAPEGEFDAAQIFLHNLGHLVLPVTEVVKRWRIERVGILRSFR